MTQSTDVSIPEHYTHLQAADSPMGRSVRWQLERIAKTHLDISEELAAAFGRAMNTGDRLGDAYIDAMFEQISTDPDWANWDTIEHGAEVFRRYRGELYPYFGMMTFNGYTLETITKPLALTGAYTGGSAFGRCLETCRLWTDTTEPGALRYQAQLGHARFYLGKDNFDRTGLPDPGLWRYAPLARVIPNFAREILRRHVPGVAGWIDQTNRRARQEFLRTNLEGGEAKFTPVDKLTR